MAEEPKRLTPLGETLRELFLKSGNLCAFPGCGQLMMDAEGTFSGQVCHIEAAEKEGQRFNPLMSNEERRSFSNLMLMCYPHHQKTNDITAYPVEKLKQMKTDHEQRFSNPDRVILETLKDWTELDVPTEARNLKRLDRVLEWNCADNELQAFVTELNAYVARLRTVPIDLRSFIGKVMKRAKKLEDTGVVHDDGTGILIAVTDVRRAFHLHDRDIVDLATRLEQYRLGDMADIDTNTDFRTAPALRIYSLESGWPLWSDIVAFCDLASESLESFTDNLDFARLDD